MNFLTKMFRAHPNAKSRFHDLQGNSAPLGRVARNYPRAIWSRIVLSAINRFPERPWISYDAAKRIEDFMAASPKSVLEFGSGNSTLWFAKRAAVLHSVEHNPEWYLKMQEKLAKTEKYGSVVHELRKTEEDYSTFRAHSGAVWDVILIDGIWRLPVAYNHIEKLAPDGILYLDNSDADTSSNLKNEVPELLNFLQEWAMRTNRTVEIFTDFPPTALHATQGRLYSSRPA